MTSVQRATVLFAGNFVAVAVLGYVFHLVLGWQLSVADFGRVAYVLSILALAGLFLVNAYPWLAARYLAQEKGRAHRRIVLSALRGNLLLSLALTVALAGAWALGLVRMSPPILGLVAAGLVATGATAVVRSSLQGTFRFGAASLVMLVEHGVRVLCLLPLLAWGLGVTGAALALVLGSLAALAVGLAWLAPRLEKGGDAPPEGMRAMVVPMFLGVATTSLLVSLDVPALKLLAGDAADVAAGLYQSATLLARLPAYLVGAAVAALFPFLSRALHDRAAAAAVTGRAVKYVLVGVLPVSLFLALAPRASLGVLFPAAYADAAPLLALLAPAMLFLSLITVVAAAYQAAQSPLVPAAVLSSVSALHVATMIVLVPRIGAQGAAVSSLVASGLGLAVLAWRFTRDFARPRWSGGARLLLALPAPVAFLLVLPPRGPVATVLSSGAFLALWLGGLLATRFLTLDEVRATLGELRPRQEAPP